MGLDVVGLGLAKADAARRYGPGRGGQLDARRVPLFTRQGVVLRRGVSTINAPLGYPCILKADGLIPSAPGRYLALSSTDHGSSPTAGIYASWFDSFGDPWSTPQLIVQYPGGTQTETPWIIYNRATGLLHLFGQEFGTAVGRTGQVTLVWTTTPARFAASRTDWDYAGISHGQDHLNDNSVSFIKGGAHFGYQRVTRLGGMWISRGLVVGGNFSRTETFYSLDGLKFYRDYRPSNGQTDLTPSGLRSHVGQILAWNGDLFGVGSLRAAGGVGGADSTAVLVMGPVNRDLTGYAGPPETIFTPAASGAGVEGDNGDVKSYCLYIDEGTPHLFYSSDATTISYAKAA